MEDPKCMLTDVVFSWNDFTCTEFQVNLMGTATNFPYDTVVRREVYRANGLDNAAETAAALAMENSLTNVDEQVSWNIILQIYFVKTRQVHHWRHLLVIFAMFKA